MTQKSNNISIFYTAKSNSSCKKHLFFLILAILTNDTIAKRGRNSDIDYSLIRTNETGTSIRLASGQTIAKDSFGKVSISNQAGSLKQLIWK